MAIGNFIKKLIETNTIWGVRAKQLAGINDAGNTIITSIVVSTADNSIDFAPLLVPSFFKVGQYIRIFGGTNDSRLLRISKIFEGTKLEVEETVIADSGIRRVTARLWEIHDDPRISRPSSSGSTMFNVHNRDNTGLPDGSALATAYAEHYHDEEGDDLTEAFVPYGDGIANNSTGLKGQWSYNPKEGTLLFCIANNTWINLYTLENLKKDNFFKTETLLDQFIPISNVQSADSNGKKGQWSWDNTNKVLKYCIAENTWTELTTLEHLERNFVSKAELVDSFVYSSKIKDTSNYGKKGQWSWNQKDNTLLYCIADNTWVNLYTLENIKIDNFIKIASLIDGFVPPSLVTNNNAAGKKGQWSVQVGHSSHKGYFKLCIATDTWIRFEVETLF